jgi:hypothetical protein
MTLGRAPAERQIQFDDSCNHSEDKLRRGREGISLARRWRDIGGRENLSHKFIGNLGRSSVVRLERGPFSFNRRSIRSQVFAAMAADPEVQAQPPALARRRFAVDVLAEVFQRFPAIHN